MSPQDIHEEVQRLRSRDATEREHAERRLAALTADDVRQLLDWSRTEHQTTNALGSGYAAFLGLGLGLIGIICIVISVDAASTNASVAFVTAGIGLACLACSGQMIRFVAGAIPDEVDKEALSRVTDRLVSVPLLVASLDESNALLP